MGYLAIDLGSSYIKAALIDPENGSVTHKSKMPVNKSTDTLGSAIYEIEMSGIMEIIYELIHSYRKLGGPLDGLLLSTQMHGFVYSYATYGPDTYVSWQDARCLNAIPGESISYLDAMKKIVSHEAMRGTGVYLKPALGMCNLYALMQSHGTEGGNDVAVYTLGSYVINKLTGHNVCHITNAAPLGLVDITSGTWRQDLLSLLGFENLRLPRITTRIEPCGDFVLDGERIPVYPDVGDVQCAVLGADAGQDEAIINMATAGQIIKIYDNTSIGNADPRYYEVRPYFHGEFCHVISRMPGGRNLDVLVDFIRDIGHRVFSHSISRDEAWERIMSDFRYYRNPGLYVDIGFYELPDRLADGSFRGIDRSNLTLDRLMSAAFNNIGETYAEYLQIINQGSNWIQGLIFCGGAIRNNTYVQDIIRMVTGLPGRPSPMEDEVFAGLLKIAQWCASDKMEKRCL